jgi:WD40 repeat protein
MGAAGAAGMGGTGGVPMVVDPPSLTKCSEYSHTGTSTTCMENDPDDYAVWSAAFSPDGKYLLTGGGDGRVKVWAMNGATPTFQGTVLPANHQSYIAFSPDGKLVAVGSDLGQLTIHNTTTWAVMSAPTGMTGHIEGIGFSADGTQVIAVDKDMNLGIFTVGSTAAPRIVPLPDVGFALAVSPVKLGTSQWIAVGYYGGFADLLDINDPTSLPTQALQVTSDPIYSTMSLAFAPNGKLLATGGEDGVTSFWTVPPGATPKPVTPAITTQDTNMNPQSANGVAFSPDGRFVSVSAGSDRVGGKTGLWDSVMRGFRGAYVPTDYPASVAFSPNGKIIAGGEIGCGWVYVCAD